MSDDVTWFGPTGLLKPRKSPEKWEKKHKVGRPKGGWRHPLWGRPDEEVLKELRSKLTPLQVKFVQAYVDPNSPGYLDGKAAYLQVAPHVTPKTAESYSCKLMSKPNVKATVKEALEAVGLKDKVERSLVKIVDGFNNGDPKIRPKDAIAVADITYKVCGDYAPEKHAVVNLTPEAREKEYEALIEKIRAAQKIEEPKE